MEAPLVISVAVGLLALCLLAKLISIPISLLLKFVTNSICGALMLMLINFFGVGIEITIFKAFLAGVFGIPGVIGIIIWDKLL